MSQHARVLSVQTRMKTLHEELLLAARTGLWPEKPFFAMTLDQLKGAVQPCYDLRAEIAETQKRLTSLIAQCKDADASAIKLAKNIVHAVKADPAEGENSPLYAAMGYVRASEPQQRSHARAESGADIGERAGAGGGQSIRTSHV